MHASPEGHEWSGKGAQGYMIIMGVILRPTLMIFGLVGALILVNVLIMLMKVMFMYPSGLVNLQASLGPVAFIVMFCIYVWLSIKIVHRSLDMISEVPSGIVNWIGGGHDPLDSQAAQQGNSFVGGVMSKGEGAAQASAGAMGGLKSKKLAQAQAAEGRKADVANNENLISAINGGKSDAPTTSSNPPKVN